MNIRDIFITLRYKISYGSTVEWYNFWYIVLRKKRKIIPQVASIDETIRKIIDDRCSVSRFGDGEVLLTSPEKEIRFQKGDPLLAKRLTEVLQSHEEGHIVCISDAFRDLYRYNRKSRRFWRTHFYSGTKILQYIRHSSLYGLCPQRRFRPMVSRHEGHLGQPGHRLHRRGEKPARSGQRSFR